MQFFGCTFTLLLLVIIILQGARFSCVYLSTYLSIYISIGFQGSWQERSLNSQLHMAVKATIGEADWRTAYFVSTTYVLLLFQAVQI